MRLHYLTSDNTFNALVAVDIAVTADVAISTVDVQGWTAEPVAWIVSGR
jgi:hypothetical protein